LFLNVFRFLLFTLLQNFVTLEKLPTLALNMFIVLNEIPLPIFFATWHDRWQASCGVKIYHFYKYGINISFIYSLSSSCTLIEWLFIRLTVSCYVDLLEHLLICCWLDDWIR
jgi:hypothetical protein